LRRVIKFDTEEGSLTLPLHYNHFIQAFIYRNIDETLATRLHEEGYPYEKRKFKLFTFSRLLSYKRRLNINERTITLYDPIYLKIGSLHTDILESLAVHLIKKGEIAINRQKCRFAAVEVEMPVEADGAVLVRAISPITVYSTLFNREGEKKTYFYNPWEKEFAKLVGENLVRKAAAFYEKPPEAEPQNFKIKPVRVSKRNEIIINFKGYWIKGWTGIYELSLPRSYFEIAYNAGLGSKNSQGFGMVEIVRET